MTHRDSLPTHQLYVAKQPYDITISKGILVRAPLPLWALVGLSYESLQAQCQFRGWELNKKTAAAAEDNG